MQLRIGYVKQASTFSRLHFLHMFSLPADKIDGDIVIPNDEYETELAQQKLDDELRLAAAAVTSLAPDAAGERPADLPGAVTEAVEEEQGGLVAGPLSHRGKCARCDPDCNLSRRKRKKCTHKRRSRKRNRHRGRKKGRGKWRKGDRRRGGGRRRQRKYWKKRAYKHSSQR